jgi:beta-mannosidase
VPGTAAGALRDAGRDPRALDLDTVECWFRAAFDCEAPGAGEQLVLVLGGVATVADVLVNGEQVLHGESMFLAHRIDVTTLLRDRNELEIRCRALSPLLRGRRSPRARWRTGIASNDLRFFRTMLLGRCPGFAPGPAAVGPWRPVALERERESAIDGVALRPRLEGSTGVVSVVVRLRGAEPPDAVEVECGGARASFPVVDGVARGELAVPMVARWWPHTHGEPALHRVVVTAGALQPVERRVGFRSLDPGRSFDVDAAPLRLAVNGVDVFARGAVWTPPDFVSLASDRASLERALARMRDSGMNMVRLPGTGAYESPDFHDLCDELGILVWQDLMFANFDYPVGDEEFAALVEREVRQELAAVAGRPSLAVVCGNSEVEQQAAMLGVDPALARGALFGELVPRLVDESGADAAYVPSSPSGGVLPFRLSDGVAHYFGVGGYRRPLGDARAASVGFASECLALANVPSEETLAEAELERAPVHHPRWKAGVPRDAGASWDFDDVRDWYLREVFGVAPEELRRTDPGRYLELSRAVGGEVMAEVLGEWRRPASSCAGALVLCLHDLVAGAGWGLVDAAGRPKVPLAHLRRALAPVAVWSTDEGLNGVAVHVANDRDVPLAATLRAALYRGLEVPTYRAEEQVRLEPHAHVERDLEELLGQFVDASWSYRFGPPGHDAVVLSLEGADGELLSQSFRFPSGRPLRPESAERLGLSARVDAAPAGVEVTISTRRLAYGVRISAAGWQADDDAFAVEPGGSRAVRLRPLGDPVPFVGSLTAVNLDESLPLRAGGTDAPGRA